MRFSLKWLLAAAVYVAVAAAALSQQSPLYGDLLWGMTLLVLLFAALLAIFMHGKGRIIATGFLMAGTAFLGHELIARTYSSASARLLMAVGYDAGGVAFPAASAPPLTPPVAESPYAGDAFADDIFGSPAVQQPPPGITVVSLDQFVRAGNAVGVVVMGLLGALVGVFAAPVLTVSAKT